MEIINLKNIKLSPSVLKSVAVAIRRGAVVVYPTDTAYALGSDATNVAAVRRIFKIKGRPFGKAMPIICADANMVNKYFLHAIRYTLYAKKYWPGPLSIVVRAKKGIARQALFRGTAAVRVPDSKIARTLSKFLGRPLVATSANLSGQPACYSVRALLRQFNKQPSPALRAPSPALGRGKYFSPPPVGGRVRERGIKFIILDSGALPRRKPSTIIRISKDGSIKTLRKGSVRIRH